MIGREHLERVHGLDHGAELGPLRRAAAGQVLVAGEDAGGLAVVLSRRSSIGKTAFLSFGSPESTVADAAVLQRHGGVHAVGVELELAQGLARELEVLELGAPVVALGEGLAGQVERPGLAGPGVEPDHGDGEVGRSHLRPAIQRLLVDDLVDLPAALEQGRE